MQNILNVPQLVFRSYRFYLKRFFLNVNLNTKIFPHYNYMFLLVYSSMQNLSWKLKTINTFYLRFISMHHSKMNSFLNKHKIIIVFMYLYWEKYIQTKRLKVKCIILHKLKLLNKNLKLSWKKPQKSRCNIYLRSSICWLLFT